MSFFPFYNMKDVKKKNIVLIRLWGLVRECFLAVAAPARMAAGSVAKAIWLAVRCEPEVEKKVPLLKQEWKKTWMFQHCL